MHESEPTPTPPPVAVEIVPPATSFQAAAPLATRPKRRKRLGATVAAGTLLAGAALALVSAPGGVPSLEAPGPRALAALAAQVREVAFFPEALAAPEPAHAE